MKQTPAAHPTSGTAFRHCPHGTIALLAFATALVGFLMPTLAQTTPSNRPPAATPMGVNVRDFGAIGDGQTDDTDALQRALDSTASPVSRKGLAANKTLWLPAGRYRITRTLELTSLQSGIELIGSGVPWSQPDPTVIVYDGPAEKPAILMSGVNQSILRNFAVDGGGRARAAIEVKTVRGVAATGMSWTRLKLGNAENGLLIGDDGIGHNGDCSSFYELTFHDVKYGFHTVADQNMEYTFIRCSAVNADVGFWFEKGGDASVFHAGGYNVDTYFKFDNPGVNNGNLTVIGLRYEHYGRNNRRGAVFEGGKDATVSFIGLCSTVTGVFPGKNWPGDTKTPNFILHPGAQVRVAGSILSGATASITGSSDQPAWITFDDCRFKHSDDPRTDIKAEGNAGYEIRNSTINNRFVRSFVKDQTSSEP